MNGLSLCSGIAGLDLGIAAAFEFMGAPCRTVGYVERDAYAAATLVARMEDSSLEQAPVFDDLATFDGTAWCGVVDLVSAGFPCQPWSHAGKRKGLDDHRWIWPEIARIIGEVGPRFVVLENVSGLVSGGGLAPVLGDLARLGFDAEWLSLRAADAGAPHQRQRVFILAYRTGPRLTGTEDGEADRHDAGERAWRCESERDGGDVEHARSAGRSEVSGSPSCDEGADEGRATEHHHVAQRPDEGMADARREGQQGIAAARPARPDDGDAGRGGGTEIFPPGPGDIDRWRAVLAASPHLAPAIEPGLRVVVDGTPLLVDESRADQLRCAGNGVVPLQAAAAVVELFWRISMSIAREAGEVKK